MNTIKNRPYIPIFATILLILVLAMFNSKDFIDIQLHDMYLVITPIHLSILLSIYLGIVGIVYWLLREKKLVPWMTILHVTCTILVCVFFQIFSLKSNNFIEVDFITSRIMNQILMVVILTSFLSQVIFAMNIFVSLIKKPHMD